MNKTMSLVLLRIFTRVRHSVSYHAPFATGRTEITNCSGRMSPFLSVLLLVAWLSNPQVSKSWKSLNFVLAINTVR
jgi:hypothetical protein